MSLVKPMDKGAFSLSVKRAVAVSLLLHGIVLALLGKILYSTEKPAFKIIPVRLYEMLKTEVPPPLPSTENPIRPEVKERFPVPPEKAPEEYRKNTKAPKVEKRKEKEAPLEALPVVPVEVEASPRAMGDRSVLPAAPVEAVGEDAPQSPVESIETRLAQKTIAHEEAHGLEAPPASLVQGNEMSLYMSMVREKIEKAKFYPAYAKKRGYEGSVGVTFTIMPGGNVSGVEVVSPASVDLLNKAAEKAVQDAAPFLPRPKSLEDEEIKMKVELVFRLG